MIIISYKVAVASSDGKYVNQHFGKAEKFLIIEIKDDDTYEYLELRECPPRCGASEEIKRKSIELISDCKALLVTRIGPSAAQKLSDGGIEPLIMPMMIEDALKELINT